MTLPLFILIAGCGGADSDSEQVGRGSTPVSITFSIPHPASFKGLRSAAKAVSEGVSSIKIEISSHDMGTITDIFDISAGETVSRNYDVPVGTGRLFSAKAFSGSTGSGALLYHGERTEELSPGEHKKILISMKDVAPPAVSSTSPADKATDVAINTLISASFSEEMDESTITTATFILVDESNNKVEGAVTYKDTTATFKPSDKLVYETGYTATIITGVKDSAGNTLTKEYTWNFNTGVQLDFTPPEVVSTNPDNGAPDVDVTTSIAAIFSEAMDASTITTATFMLVDDSNDKVAGTVTYKDTTATFKPTDNLVYNTTYKATITVGIKDAAGNALATEYAWSFTTETTPPPPPPDTTPPTVISTNPERGDTDVAVNGIITAGFSENMNISSITNSSFTLSDGVSNIVGEVTYSGTTATFTPSGSLAYETTYTATITTEIRDAAGNALESYSTWSFTTAAVNPLVGTWGIQCLKQRSGLWLTEGVRKTFNSDGTGTKIYQSNRNGEIITGTENFTYSSTSNPDGSLTVTINYSSDTVERRWALSDNRQMAIIDGTSRTINGDEITDRQDISAAVRIDTAKTYTNADLSGEYYYLGYKHDATGDWGAYYGTSSGAFTFDGRGNWSSTDTNNKDGIIITGSETGYTYTVNADGTVDWTVAGTSFLDVTYLSGDGKLMTNIWSDKSTDWANNFFMKKGDKTYSTTDLAGAWAVSVFGDNSGTIFWADFGSMTCDSNGNCSGTMKEQRDGIIAFNPETFLANAVVAADGSFGGSLATGAPAYAGAIGNNGNTLIMNLSFDQTALNDRNIVVSVRCSDCTDLVGIGE